MVDGLPCSDTGLPSDGLLRVLSEVLDAAEFQFAQLDRTAALHSLNTALGRDGLQAFLDGAGRAHVRNLGTDVTSASKGPPRRTWSKEELARRARLEAFIERASEGDLIEEVLVPIFSQLGFRRISVAGHKDKSLEYGKDLWMKYQLPTGHTIYFGVQAKRGKLDATGKSKNQNVTEVLNQVRMMLDHPVWDPETNKQNLLDHVFVACGGEITKQAKNWLAQHLDKESRRHVLFMDRSEILDLGASSRLRVLDPQPQASADDVPF